MIGPAPAGHRGTLTALTVVVVIGCAAATWWQVERALAGNFPSYCYAVLWPLYGCYVIYLWARLRRTAPPVEAPPAPLEEDDAELLAYNRFLATRRADVRRRTG